MSGSWVRLDHTHRSRACARDTHHDCAHLGGPHLGFSAPLCSCACHSACPLAEDFAAPVKAWRQLCTCPGADQERTRQDAAGEQVADVDLKQWEKDRRAAKARKRASEEALQAVRAAAAGKSREEIRDLLNAELRSRGVQEDRDRIPGEVSAGKRTLIGRLLKRPGLRALTRGYGAAIRQAHGETVKHPGKNPLGLAPAQQASLLADQLAMMTGGDAAAAELLGVTADQVAAHREHAMEIHWRMFFSRLNQARAGR